MEFPTYRVSVHTARKLALGHGICTKLAGPSNRPQIWSVCVTCENIRNAQSGNQNNGRNRNHNAVQQVPRIFCVSCASKCHKNHQVIQTRDIPPDLTCACGRHCEAVKTSSSHIPSSVCL
eukprot:TRINITY_DN17176_c0_g1_i1.p1 TRINITY_DN17176_c0_g1~~TRINITY_DN17176_c0_g1_i1.p1  ORF type:complete len:120 (-),score=4.51 TRINITY_DN17176_c0_g1_i1:60-419(-)